MLAKACFSMSCNAESDRIIVCFSVNSSGRGYHVYQSIWPNPSRDYKLTDVRTGSWLEMLSQGVLTTVGHIPRPEDQDLQSQLDFIAWWYELTIITISSYSMRDSMCSCDHLKQLAKQLWKIECYLPNSSKFFTAKVFYYTVYGNLLLVNHCRLR